MRVRQLLALSILTLAARGLSAQAADQASIEQASRTKLKSDLRNLVTAQEAYFADHSSYADVIDNLKFRPSAGSQVSFVATQNNAWAAVAVDASMPGRSCVIFINLAEKYRPKTMQEKRSAESEGFPLCDGDPKPEK
jgi:Tfp pilus assembly protein PilE